MKVPLASIKTDGGTQPRRYTDPATIEEYKRAMQGGAVFPPVVAFYDGADYWLADGFHRFIAGHELGFDDIEVDVRHGTVRDARLYAVGANATHGKPRTHADKRHAVMLLFSDPEWVSRSDTWVAEQCNVERHFVGEVRTTIGAKSNVRMVPNGKHGPRTMDVSKLTRPEPEGPAAAEVVDEETFEATCTALRDWPRTSLHRLDLYIRKLVSSKGAAQ